MVLSRTIFALVAFFTAAWSVEQDTRTEECSTNKSIKVSKSRKTMEVFLEWARKNGAEFPKLTVNYSTDGLIRGRTIQAVDDIKTGEEVLFVPENLLMSHWRARRTRLGALVSKEAVRRKLPTSAGDLEQLLVLSTFLLHEMKESTSFWKPYTDMFPKIEHLPCNFLELCRSELIHTYALYIIEAKISNIKLTYEIYSQFGKYPWFDYLQSYLYVNSRAFSEPQVGLKMVPIADLLNHRHPYHVDYWYNDIEGKRNGYYMSARTDIKRSEEVTDTYGYPKRNGGYFAGFGFSMSNPEFSAACIHVSLKHYFPDFEKKKQVLPQLKNPPYLKNLKTTYFIDFPENYYEFHIQTVFSHLRILTQPLHITASNVVVFDMTIESEQIMLNEFIRVLEAANERMKSSLGEDEDLLEELKAQGEQADTRMIQLVRLRLEERNVLLVWINFANECLTILQTEAISKTTRSSDYLEKVIFPLVRGERAII